MASTTVQQQCEPKADEVGDAAKRQKRGNPLQIKDVWESVPLPMWGGVWGGAKELDFEQRKFEHQTTSTATLSLAHFSPHERRVRWERN